MATQEFYIRGAEDTEARGPFNQEQLASLAEAGQVTPETLYYEAGDEQWVAIGANAALKEALFPEKKKLQIKAREKIETLNVEKEENAPITVENMLAAAEGRTEDTRDKRDPEIAQARAAKIGLVACILILLIGAAGYLLPNLDLVAKGNLAKLLTIPFAWLGAFDLVLGLLLILGMVTLYPLVRFRAALGLGFLGFLFWTQGASHLVLLALAAAVGLYCCTVLLRLGPVLLFAVLGLLGTGGLAWHLLS